MTCCEKSKKINITSSWKERIDPVFFSGLKTGGIIGNILMALEQGRKEDSTIEIQTVRYKSNTVQAIFLDKTHIVEDTDGKKEVRRTGWLVQGPGNSLVYVPEEEFSKFFELVKE